jgi:4-amino-4-deoxy-L-arabinose transferase-like glycosyltransferase
LSSARGNERLAAWPTALLVASCVPVILFRLGSYGVVSGDEAFYHGVAESMVDSGNWLSIDFRGQHRPYDTFMNAPLQYWLKASLIEVFGSNYWTMRLPSALFGVATVVLTARLAAFAGTSAALLAGFVQLTTFQFVFLHSARVGVLETALSFFLGCAAIAFLRAVRDGRSFLAHHVCLAVLLNLKLPIVLVPLAADLAYFALRRDARPHLLRWLATGLAVAPLALAWHTVQALALGEPILDVFAQMVGRSSGAAGLLERRVDNLAFYASTLTFGTFPYVLVYPLAALAWLRGWRRRGGEEQRRWLVYALYALTVVVFFSAVAKRSGWYLIPALPFLSAFAGVWMARIWRDGLAGRAQLALAVTLPCLLWVDVYATSFNPFNPYATAPSAAARWREIGGAPTAIALPFAVLTLAFVSMGLRAWVGERMPRFASRTLIVALLGFAAVRIMLPLAHTEHQSEAERVRRLFDEAALTGRDIRFPVEVSQGSARSAKTRFYFARDFEIVALPRGPRPYATGYRLYPEGAAPE